MILFSMTFAVCFGIGLAAVTTLFIFRIIEGFFFWIGFNIGRKNAQDSALENLQRENIKLAKIIEELSDKKKINGSD